MFSVDAGSQQEKWAKYDDYNHKGKYDVSANILPRSQQQEDGQTKAHKCQNKCNNFK